MTGVQVPHCNIAIGILTLDQLLQPPILNRLEKLRFTIDPVWHFTGPLQALGNMHAPP